MVNEQPTPTGGGGLHRYRCDDRLHRPDPSSRSGFYHHHQDRRGAAAEVENTSSDTRQQISGKNCRRLQDNNDTDDADGDADTTTGVDDIATMEVIARSPQAPERKEGDISYHISCQVTPTEAVGDPTYAVVDSGTADSLNLDGSDITDTEITAEPPSARDRPSATDVNGDGDLDNDDFGTAVTPVVTWRQVRARTRAEVVVDGGGETLANLKIESITLGKSMM